MATVLQIAAFCAVLSFTTASFTNSTALNNVTSEFKDTAKFDLQTCSTLDKIPTAHKNDCCLLYHRNFRRTWYIGGNYLTSYLSTLKKWGCVEYQKECLNPVYDFTPFTKLVYKNFCDRGKLFETCTGTLEDGISKLRYLYPSLPTHNNSIGSMEDNWTNLTASLRPELMDMEELNQPCVQIALFDRPSGGVGRFHEISQPFTLFCPITWVGYDIDTAMERDVSPWTSWSITCRSNLVIILIVVAVLCLAVIVANVLVLSVYTTTPKLLNSQAVYKTSVAVSDLLSGLIVIPNVIVFAYLIFIVPRKMGEVIPSKSGMTQRLPGGESRSVATSTHIRTLGFFTTLTLTVSLYTLLAASFDRLWAIFKPLSYNKSNAKKHARIISIVIWTLAIFISTIPYFVTTLEYKLIPGLLVTSVGDTASVLMAIALALPLILVWATNILIFRSAKKHSRVRQRMRSTITKKENPDDDMEKRLSKVLGLMVGVFTACVLPATLTTLISAIFDNIVFPLPDLLDTTAAVAYDSTGFCFGIILLSNSLWNCLIYSTRGADFREAVKSLRFIKIAGSTVHSAITSMRRLSEVTVVYYRRKSSASTDLNAASMQTTRVTMNSENSSSGLNLRRGTVTGTSAEYYPAVTANKSSQSNAAVDSGQNRDESDVTLSVFDSYAVDAGADRLYLSVMENIEET